MFCQVQEGAQVELYSGFAKLFLPSPISLFIVTLNWLLLCCCERNIILCPAIKKERKMTQSRNHWQIKSIVVNHIGRAASDGYVNRCCRGFKTKKIPRAMTFENMTQIVGQGKHKEDIRVSSPTMLFGEFGDHPVHQTTFST